MGDRLLLGAGSSPGNIIPVDLYQLLFHSDGSRTIPAYYTEEEWAKHSHLLKDYSLGVGDLREKRLGYCYDFDGVNDYVVSGFGKIAAGSTPSISFWIKPTGAQADKGIIQFGNGLSDGTPWIFLKRVDPTTVQWYLAGSYQIIQAVADDAFCFLTLTYDGAVWRSYANGVAGNAFTGALGTVGGENLWLGNGYGGFFRGSIYDFRVYNDTLTADEITYLYTNGQSGTDPGSDNLVAHYPLQEESGTTAYDISGNGNHGTILNAVTSGVGSIHQPDAGVVKSYANDEGGSELMFFDGVNDYVSTPSFTLADNEPFRLKLKTIIPSATGYARVFSCNSFSFSLRKSGGGSDVLLDFAGTSHIFSLNTVDELVSLEIAYDGTNLVVTDNGIEVFNIARAYTGGTATAFLIGAGGGTYWRGVIFDVELYISNVLNRSYAGTETKVWTDTSGNSRNGTVYGSPVTTVIPNISESQTAIGTTPQFTGRCPYYGLAKGPAWQGDGSTVYVDLGSPIIPATADFELEFAVYLTGFVSSTYEGLFSQVNGGDAGRFDINHSEDKIRFTDAGGPKISLLARLYDWNKVVFSRTGNTVHLEVNSATSSFNLNATSLQQFNSILLNRWGLNYSDATIGAIKISTGGLTTTYSPIEGTRNVAVTRSDGTYAIITSAVKNGVDANLYTLGNGYWKLPEIENGSYWSGTTLYPASPGASVAVNGEGINIPASKHSIYGGLLVDRTGGIVSPADIALGLDQLIEEAADDPVYHINATSDLAIRDRSFNLIFSRSGEYLVARS